MENSYHLKIIGKQLSGDCIAFLPNDLTFKVLSKGDRKSTVVIGKDEVTKDEVTMKGHHDSEDVEVTNEVTKDELTMKAHCVVDSEDVEVTNKEVRNRDFIYKGKKELVAVLLEKKRNLLSWMTNSKGKR